MYIFLTLLSACENLLSNKRAGSITRDMSVRCFHYVFFFANLYVHTILTYETTRCLFLYVKCVSVLESLEKSCGFQFRELCVCLVFFLTKK